MFDEDIPLQITITGLVCDEYTAAKALSCCHVLFYEWLCHFSFSVKQWVPEGPQRDRAAESLNDKACTGHKSELLQCLPEELSMEHLPREVLNEALHLDAILLQSSGNLEQCGLNGKGLHDVALGRLESQTSLGIS
jgi:hypothetical protein